MDWILPFILGISGLYWGIGKRFRLFRFSRMVEVVVKLFIGFVAGSILMFLQMQMLVSSRTLKVVENVADIGNPLPGDCYRITDFQLDTAGYGGTSHSCTYWHVARYKHEIKLVATKFWVIPFVDNSRASGPFTYWLTGKYSITGEQWRRSDSYRKYLFERLDFQLRQEYKKRRYDVFNYLEVVQNSFDYPDYLKALKDSKCEVANPVVLLKPVYCRWEQATYEYLWIAFGLLAGVIIILLYLIRTSPHLTPQQWMVYRKSLNPDKEEWERRV